MNKAEEQAVADDYAKQRGAGERTGEGPRVFAVPRDDARYEPPAEMGLNALRDAIGSVRPADVDQRTRGLANRVGDLMGRLRDQVVAPLRAERREAERVVASLRAMESPAASVDVNPLPRAPQRRPQQRGGPFSMGPGRGPGRGGQGPGPPARRPRP